MGAVITPTNRSQTSNHSAADLRPFDSRPSTIRQPTSDHSAAEVRYATRQWAL
jgi:hypothetical protein